MMGIDTTTLDIIIKHEQMFASLFLSSANCVRVCVVNMTYGRKPLEGAKELGCVYICLLIITFYPSFSVILPENMNAT